MATYARVVNGIVVEVFIPPSGKGPDDCFHPDFAAEFHAAPDNVAQGWTYDGHNFAAPAPPLPPSLAQQAGAMLAAGIAITSASNPSLNATYGCDDATYAKDTGILSGLNAGLTPPGGAIIRTDTKGDPHQFTSAQFHALCQAKWDYIQALETIIGGGPGPLPAQPVEIG